MTPGPESFPKILADYTSEYSGVLCENSERWVRTPRSKHLSPFVPFLFINIPFYFSSLTFYASMWHELYENVIDFPGISKQRNQETIPGNDSDSYALQVFQGTNARVESSKNKIRISRAAAELEGCSVGVLLNLSRQHLNLYLDGQLLTDIGRPKGPSFRAVNGTFCASLCLYGANVGMSLVTGIATPSPPGLYNPGATM